MRNNQTSNSKTETGGAITLEEKQTLRSKASDLLSKVKDNRIERNKVPYRVDAKTVILVSPSKLKTLNR